MSKFDEIRPFYDTEINEGVQFWINHPYMEALIKFCMPDTPAEVWKDRLSRIQSVREFQTNFIYHGVQQVIKKSTDGLSTSGFDKLKKNTSYLFVSNHRDIILDTCLLNNSLFENGLVMTASAIGDNLVKRDFMKNLAKLNRNFLVQRGLTPRDMLQSSKTLAELIGQFILRENRSVWIAQREGRTKDGNDATNPAVLKMLAMGSGDEKITDYLKNLRIVPVAISYEYDPTDALKMPQYLAETNKKEYVKDKNEDLLNLLSGVVGQKKHIHIHIGDVLNTEIDQIALDNTNINKQILALAETIDNSIVKSYKLWPTNYIAFDIIYKTDRYKNCYTETEKSLFERRLAMRIPDGNPVAIEGFLSMYANPVVNKSRYTDAI
jgi:1-acyl-sn-glycerol-3-phosphate acyltransferase